MSGAGAGAADAAAPAAGGAMNGGRREAADAGAPAAAGRRAVGVRLAGLQDAALLAELRRTYAEEDRGPVEDPGFEARYLSWQAAEADRRVVWVAENGPRPVGMLNLTVFERMPRPGQPVSRWGYIGNVFVLVEYRDRGIGRRLLDAAVEHARRAAFARLVLSPTERAVPFYARAGFRPATSLLIMEPVDGANRSAE